MFPGNCPGLIYLLIGSDIWQALSVRSLSLCPLLFDTIINIDSITQTFDKDKFLIATATSQKITLWKAKTEGGLDHVFNAKTGQKELVFGQEKRWWLIAISLTALVLVPFVTVSFGFIELKIKV